MNNRVNLQAIRKYNPSNLNDEDVIGNFLVRQRTYEVLLDQITKTKPNAIPQHHLIIGQRGMGKTTLLKRLEVAMRTESPHKKHFIPLQYPEEMYNIDQLSKFWLNTLDVLVDHMDKVGDKQNVRTIEKKITHIITEKESLPEKAFDLFTDITSEMNKRPVLLIDNLDLVFNGLNSEEQWQLREKMSKPNAPIFVGASAAPFKAVFEYDQAFYDYFKLITLEPLSYETFQSMLLELAQSLEDEKVKAEFFYNQNRIQALYRLTGGNIRTAIILFDALSTGFGLDVSDDLDKLLDEVTPIYKARMDELSDQMRVVVDTIALHWDAIDLKELREKSFLENSTLSPQIKRLRQMGWISTVASKRSKGDKYEMTERFFNVWYLMRRSTRRHRREIMYLAKFLDLFYNNSVEKVANSLLRKKDYNASDKLLCLALSETKISEQTKNDLLALSERIEPLKSENEDENLTKLSDVELEILELIKKNVENSDYTKAEKLLLEARDKFPKRTKLIFALGELYQFYIKDYTLAENAYLEILDLNEKDSNAWNSLGMIYQYYKNDPERAFEAYEKATQFDKNNPYAWNNLGVLYLKYKGDIHNALYSYERAIEIKPEFVTPHINLGNLYAKHYKKFDNAKTAFEKAIKIDKDFVNAWVGLGVLYLENYQDFLNARNCFEQVLKLEPNNAKIWQTLGALYYNNFQEFDLAEAAFKKSKELDPNFAEPLIGLGNIYQFHNENFEEAEISYRKAIQLDPTSALAWNGLGILMYSHQNIDEAFEIFKKTIDINPNLSNPWFNLGNIYLSKKDNHEAALSSYLNGLEKDPNHASIWINVASINSKFKKDFSKAKDALERAISLDPNDAYPYVALAGILQNNFSKYEEAKEYYNRAIMLDPNDAYAWNGLGSLLFMQYKDYQNSKIAFEKALEINPDFSFPWNNLGLIYFQVTKDFEKAKSAFQNSMKSTPFNSAAWLNSIYLERDIFGNYSEAKKLFEQLDIVNMDEFKDTYYLHESTFHLYEMDFGLGSESLIKAINNINNSYPTNSFDDWKQYAAIAVKKGFGEQMMKVFEDSDINLIMLPYYEACKALQEHDFEYLSEIAAEVRDVAKEIYLSVVEYSKYLK